VKATSAIIITAMLLVVIVLSAFLWMKAGTDIPVIIVAFVGITGIILKERWFLTVNKHKTDSV
tara:strand:- start:191 stop:379 length:189 start_codon:yes stop_codon:yes gene_type:complete